MYKTSLFSVFPSGALALACILGFSAPRAQAQDLAVELVASGFASPVWVGAPNGDFDRLFVIEQNTGRIEIIKNGTILPVPFLNVGSIASQNGERGLLGMAFHPDYMSNGRFFINYTDNAGDTQVVEYAVSSDPDIADSTPVQTIFSVGQPFSNHNGGDLDFGLDGKLYIGTGDGGSANDPGNRSQNGLNNLGKMIRLDVDIAAPFIPADNPFLGNPNINDEIWALGLRNPWRYSFDRMTGDLYIADVGQNQVEEIDFQPGSSAGGENYGWRCMEGTRCTGLSGCTCNDMSLTLPIQEYNHGLGCSVTGGYVYRGSTIPGLEGTYFYGDYCSSRIWSFKVVGGSVTEFTERTAELEPDGALTINNITSFGQDAAGEVYIVDPSGGEIYKIIQDCGAVNYCVGEANSFSTQGASMSYSGGFNISDNDLSLVVSGTVPNQNGLFYYGGGPLDAPFGNGRRCVGAGGAGIFRLLPVIQASAFGDAVRPVDYTAPPMNSGAGMVTPGSTWYFQWWYRDPMGGGAQFNLSDGLEIFFCP